MYPAVNVRMNKFGHLEIWKGDSINLARECDLYIQLESDVKEIMSQFPTYQRQDIDNGYLTLTYWFNDEYFGA